MLNDKRLFMVLMLMVGIVIFAMGCGKNSAPVVDGDTHAFLTVTDDLGRTVTLSKQPNKIVALSPSFLAPLGAVDAKLVGRPSSKTGVPDFAKTVEEVGAVYSINLEKVVSLKPDLVIAYQGMHDKFIPILESNRIPVIVARMKTYRDVQDKIQLFAEITGETQKGKALAAEMDEKARAIVSKIPQDHRKVAILHSTAKSVTVELEGSIAGCTAEMLGFKNVASGSKTLDKDPDSTPYSLETLVESNPDMIFVVTMGNLEEIKKRMTEDVESNPAWRALAAVKNKAIYFLPQELFLLNPGLQYPEAIETMAKLAYPEAF